MQQTQKKLRNQKVNWVNKSPWLKGGRIILITPVNKASLSQVTHTTTALKHTLTDKKHDTWKVRPNENEVEMRIWSHLID